MRENLERYQNIQPVIDSERQLAGKIVDEEVIGVLERTGYMSLQHMMLIDTVLAMPGTTIEGEIQRRIDAINAIIAFCDVEEGAPLRPLHSRKREAAPILTEKQSLSQEDEEVAKLSKAIKSVQIDSPSERPLTCFLCVGNPALAMTERIRKYNTPGSLTRHFQRRHVKIPWAKEGGVRCKICKVDFRHKNDLLNHAETKHGTVLRKLPS